MRRLLAAVALAAVVADPSYAERDPALQKAVDKAKEQIEKGRPEKAVAELQKVVEKLDTAEAHLALGRVQQEVQLIDDAVASFARARERESTDPELLVALTGITLSTGSAKDALAPAEKAVALSASADALAMLARVRLRLSELESARDAAAKAQAAGGSALAHLAQGEIQLATGHAEDAAASFGKALESEGAPVEARVGLAAALDTAGRTTEALVEARRAAADDPVSGAAAALQGLLMVRGHEGDEATWNRANQVAQEGAFRNPYSAAVHTRIGHLFEVGPYTERVGAQYEKALAIDPQYLPARLGLVRFLVRQADVDGALKLAQEAAEDAPWCGEAQFLLGRELLRRKSVAQALAALEKATERTPRNAEAHALLATAAFFLGATDQAVEACARALELRPDRLEWRTDCGLFLGRHGEYEAAAAELEKVVASPGYEKAAAHVNLGWVYRNSRPPRSEASIRAYQKALELDPEEAQAALGLGWAFFGASRYDESIEAYSRAVELDSALAAEAYDGIAWGHYFKGELDAAAEFLEQARAAGRDDARLAASIEQARLPKPPPETGPTPEELRCQELVARTSSKDAAVRARAFAELRTSGCAIVDLPDLLVWVLANDSSYLVKKAVAEWLGRLGVAGRKAIPYLEQCSRPCEFPLIATLEQMNEEAECAAARSACASALDKLR